MYVCMEQQEEVFCIMEQCSPVKQTCLPVIVGTVCIQMIDFGDYQNILSVLLVCREGIVSTQLPLHFEDQSMGE